MVPNGGKKILVVGIKEDLNKFYSVVLGDLMQQYRFSINFSTAEIADYMGWCSSEHVHGAKGVIFLINDEIEEPENLFGPAGNLPAFVICSNKNDDVRKFLMSAEKLVLFPHGIIGNAKAEIKKWIVGLS